MPRISAGLILYRRRPAGIEVLLAHPGGPLWRKKDEGAWSIPKGEARPGEDLLAAARREFQEELGLQPAGALLALSPVKQKGGKVVRAWAMEGDCDPAVVRSNTFTMEWPPRSGQMAEFPEIDRAAFFGLDEAKRKVTAGQAGLIEELQRLLAGQR